jgi:hypothetical protein
MPAVTAGIGAQNTDLRSPSSLWQKSESQKSHPSAAKAAMTIGAWRHD